MKITKILSYILLCSLLMTSNMGYVFADQGTEKVLTTTEVNKIVENKNGEYGLPNKYWNEETGEFIIPEGYTKIEKGLLPSDSYLPYITNKEKREKCLIEKLVKKIKIPNSVNYIDEGAFCGAQALEEINLPESLEYIGAEAFSEAKIKEIKWPKSVTKIEDGMFGYADLEKIEIPDTVTSIEKGAFLGTRLTEIYIPDSVVEIKPVAFCDSNMLKKVKLPNKLEKIESTTFHRNAFETIEIPESVKEIGDGGFQGCKLKEIKLSKNLKKIGNNAFWFCEDLESVEMPGVTSLGNYVFSNCDKLNRLVVSKEFFRSKEISKEAFEAEPEEFYDQEGKAVAERSVDVYVTDGIEGLNIEELKNQNKWIKSIQGLSKDTETVKDKAKEIPNTGLENMWIYIISLGISVLILIDKQRKYSK